MFTYDIQYGGDPHDKYDLKGDTNFDDFISVFDGFPWLNEIEKANENPNGCSPTLSVKNTTDEKDLWVSMAGDRINRGYLIGYAYLKTKKRLLGFGKEKIIKWVEIYLTEDMQQVKGYFKLYFGRSYEELHSEIIKLDKYGEAEARN